MFSPPTIMFMEKPQSKTNTALAKVLIYVTVAISNWEFHKPSGIAQPPKNFMQINKQGLSAGYTNSKDLSRFKDANDTRVKVVQGKKTVKKELPYSDIVFGIKNRPSTPINNVICNTYAQQSAELAK